MPTEKYAHAPEILEHCQRIGKQYDLYDNALFHTEVTDLEWDDDRSRVDHPHQPRRRVHRPVPRAWAPARCTCRSCRASPASRRSRATRSTPAGGTTTTPAATPTGAPMDKLADKRVAIIGTGATVGAVRPPPRHGLRGALRVPAHAVVGRRARQPPDRPRVVRRDRHAGLAAALARELHRQPDRRAWPRKTS